MPTLEFDLVAAWFGWLQRLGNLFVDAGSPFWWPTLATAVAAALVMLYATRKKEPASPDTGAARTWLRESGIDIGCFLMNGYLAVLIAPLLVTATILGTALVVLALGMPTPTTGAPGATWTIAAAALAFLVGDFFLYWTHRMFHRFAPLWALHRLHHSPSVLTPVTAFRFWPPEQAVHMLGFNFGVGIALGAMFVIHGSPVPPASYAGANAFLVGWSLAFAHLRHSHVPMAFPGWLSRLFVSPQMHQAHHSVDSRHHHRNYGTALAMWDWMFGTLYVPHKQERYRFGVGPG